MSNFALKTVKVEKNLKGSLDLIQLPSTSAKILLKTPSNVLPLDLKQTFPHMIWIFNEGEGDGNWIQATF